MTVVQEGLGHTAGPLSGPGPHGAVQTGQLPLPQDLRPGLPEGHSDDRPRPSDIPRATPRGTACGVTSGTLLWTQSPEDGSR